MSLKLSLVLRDLSKALSAAGIEDGPREARRIAADVLGVSMAHLILEQDQTLTPDQAELLNDFASQRIERRPLAHILGHRAFFEHDFLVTKDVLDPRPETETLVEAALAGPVGRLLDLGTGSGVILLSILAAKPEALGIGTDICQKALQVAQSNAKRLELAERCDFLRSDWFDKVRGSFDLIVSNPPYIAVDEMPNLAPELGFEPRIALTDEGDGLGAYRRITADAPAHLPKGGRLLVEIGWAQAGAVVAIFQKAGFEHVNVIPDLDGRDRVVCGTWP